MRDLPTLMPFARGGDKHYLESQLETKHAEGYWY